MDALFEEACDDLNQLSGDGCSELCQIEAGFSCINSAVAPSTCAQTCGNGDLDDGEACDDGGIINDDGCSDICLIEICGDGILNFSGGTLETCDDENTSIADGCDDTCQVEAGFICTGEPSVCTENCGNNVEDINETCDDGNQTSGDGCDELCREELCGDNIVAVGEDCDDGNLTPGDGCNAICEGEFCGDGLINNTNEVCDDGNNANADLCRGDCLGIEDCGDGLLDTDAGEDCDDGNTTSGDGCNATCDTENCGNLAINVGEDCDDGNQTNGDGCDNNCQFTCDALAVGTADSFRDPDTGHCYIMPTQTRDWNAAKTDCNNRNSGSANFRGHLATITTSDENGIVRAFETTTELWIGLTDQNDGNTGSAEGSFRWLTGERLSPFMNFNNGEPNGGGGENCVGFLQNNFNWADFACGNVKPYVCEFDFGKQCGNGFVEQGEKCDDGNTANNDGCSANCATFDCNAEGGSAREVAAISDGCFVLFENNINFDNAKADCINRGGFLATVTTSAENTELDQLENFGDDTFWIGLQDILVEGLRGWLNGESFGFNDGSFDNFNNEDCVEYANNDTWNDNNCAVNHFYACEF